MCARCPWSGAASGLLPCPAAVTLPQPCAHPSSCGAGGCEFAAAPCPLSGPAVGGAGAAALCNSLPGLLHPLPGRWAVWGRLGPRPRPRPLPPGLGPARLPPAGALRAARGRAERRCLPAPLAALRSFSAAAADMVSLGPAIRRHPRAGPRPRVGERRWGPEGTGARAVGGGESPGWLGKGGLGRRAWARRSLTGGPPVHPALGTRSDEDGEESGAGDHREVLHAPRE